MDKRWNLIHYAKVCDLDVSLQKIYRNTILFIKSIKMIFFISTSDIRAGHLPLQKICVSSAQPGSHASREGSRAYSETGVLWIFGVKSGGNDHLRDKKVNNIIQNSGYFTSFFGLILFTGVLQKAGRDWSSSFHHLAHSTYARHAQTIPCFHASGGSSATAVVSTHCHRCRVHPFQRASR